MLEDLKKVTLWQVYKATKPYYIVKAGLITDSVLERLGFDYIEETKRKGAHWYRTATKNGDKLKILKTKFKKKGFLVRVRHADSDKCEEYGWKPFNGFEWGLRPNDKAQELCDELIRKKKRHSHLIGCSIGHFFKTQKASYDEETGTITFAFASLANPVLEKFGHYDFAIYYYKDAWDECKNKQRSMLCDHELGHCGYKGEPYIKGHDIEEFSYMVQDYNLESPRFSWASDAVRRVLDTRENAKNIKIV